MTKTHEGTASLAPGDSTTVSGPTDVGTGRPKEEDIAPLSEIVEILNDRSDSVIAGADIVTNLGFVRPIDEPLLSKLGPQAVVSLMWETWEHRPEELDRDACKRLGIANTGYLPEYQTAL